MHFCTARVNIGNDRDNVAVLSENEPVSWPEILILQHVHGQEAISEVEPFATVEQGSREERQRLVEKYGEHVVTVVFGGKQGPAEMEASGAKLKEGRKWRNPITLKMETTGSGGVSKPDEPEEDPFAGVKRTVGEPDNEQPVEVDEEGSQPKGSRKK